MSDLFDTGIRPTVEYRAWKAMRWRCSPRFPDAKNYYKRGITVCERWDSFSSFYLDMGKRPSGKYTLDRINNDKGYSSDNCRWATRQEQMNNTTKTNYLLTKHGERVSLMDMSRKTGIHPETLRYRIKKGWHAEGLDTPPLKPKSRTRRSNGKFI